MPTPSPPDEIISSFFASFNFEMIPKVDRHIFQQPQALRQWPSLGAVSEGRQIDQVNNIFSLAFPFLNFHFHFAVYPTQCNLKLNLS